MSQFRISQGRNIFTPFVSVTPHHPYSSDEFPSIALRMAGLLFVFSERKCQPTDASSESSVGGERDAQGKQANEECCERDATAMSKHR